MLSYFRIQDKSMEPYCHEGDFAVVLRMSHLKEGSVVVLKSAEGRLLLKRITRKGGSGYWVEGDNKVESRDSRVFGWVSPKDILGRAWIVKRFGRGKKELSTSNQVAGYGT